MDENAGIVRNAQRRLCKLPKIRLDSGQRLEVNSKSKRNRVQC